MFTRQQNTQKSFDCVYFSDKIYLILYPITHLTLIHTIFKFLGRANGCPDGRCGATLAISRFYRHASKPSLYTFK